MGEASVSPVQLMDGGKMKLSRKATQMDQGKEQQELEKPEEGKIYRWGNFNPHSLCSY